MQRTTLRVLLLVAAFATVLAFPAAARAGWIPVGGKVNDTAAGTGQPNGAFGYASRLAHMGGQGVWAAWINEPFSGGDTPQTRVARFSGGSWLRPGGTAAGANPMVASTSRAESIDIANVGGVPWVAWTEKVGNANAFPMPQLFVKQWNGSAWVDADGSGTPAALNVDQTTNAFAGHPRIANVGGRPCVTWWETPANEVDKAGGSVYVKCFNGTSWIQRGGALNTTPAKNATRPSIVAIPHPGLGIDILHVAWTEVDTSEMVHVRGAEAGGTIHVARFEFPSSWVPVGGGIRADPSTYAHHPDLMAIGSVPYLAWQEKDLPPAPSDPFLAPTRVFVTAFNGTTWSTGNRASDPSRDAGGPRIAGIDGVPHVAYSEADNEGFNPGPQRSVRVRKAVPGGWEALEGQTPIRREDHHAAGAGDLIDVNGMPYLSFGEGGDVWVDRWLITVNNTERPAATGSPKVGQTLTCDPGTWTLEPGTGDILYQYSWERATRSTADEDTQGWQSTGVFVDQYTVRADDAGWRVRCRVTAQNAHDRVDALSPSVRTDVDRPFVLSNPVVRGTAISGTAHTCDPGKWNSQADFTYQWVRERFGEWELIPGATDATYVPVKSREPNDYTNAAHDGGRRIACQVEARNDVGVSNPTRSEGVLIVDGVPFNVTAPELRWLEESVNPLARVAECNETGGWLDDYAFAGIPGYSYEFQWQRNYQDIPGATDQQYRVTVEDLGAILSCIVHTSNPAGRSRGASTGSLLVPLPTVTTPGEMLVNSGRNLYVPVNMMPIGREYREEVDRYVVEQLTATKDAETSRCRSQFGNGLNSIPPNEQIAEPLSERDRCRILVLHRFRVLVQPNGVKYQDRCVNPEVACLDLGFALPPVDPAKPPPIDAAIAMRLAPVTPTVVLWDVDNDGRTDATCPPGAPIMRTMLSRGQWNPRAIMVYPDSARTGVFSSATASFSNPPGVSNYPPGRMRDAQPLMCRTSLEQPPDPQRGPCVTEGTIGKVHVTGNMCPIAVRSMTPDEVQTIRLKSPDLLPILEKLAAELEQDEVNAAKPRQGPILAPGDRGIGGLDALAVKATDTAAHFVNTASSRADFSGIAGDAQNISPFGNPKISTAMVRSFEALVPDKANFTLDQIYITEGPFTINGVKIDPHDSLRGVEFPGLVVPTDVSEAFGEATGKLTEMKILVEEAKTELDAMVLSARNRVKASLKDSAQSAVEGVLQSDYLPDVGELAKKLDFGPFKLVGKVDVKLNNDQTATITTFAELPLIKAGKGGSPISGKVVMQGDRSGRLQFDSIEIKVPRGYLGAVDLQDLFLRYDVTTGVAASGKIILIPPSGPTIELQQLNIDNEGTLTALRVAFAAPAGTGLKVGPGIFLTGLSGGYDDNQKKLFAGATIGAGPSVTDGCPIVGLKGELTVAWPGIVSLESRANVAVICIPLVEVEFKANSDGYVSIATGVDLNFGPLFYTAKGGGQFDGKRGLWQLEYRGRGGIKDVPIVGSISLGLQGVLSNAGLAVCGSIEILWEEIAAGAGLRFPAGRPPLTPSELFDTLSTIRVFTGCSLGAYRSLPSNVGGTRAHAAQAGQQTFQLPRAPRGMALSFEGDGGPPQLTLRAPNGKVYDFTDAQEGKLIDDAWGVLVEDESRTVVLLRNPQPGGWTVQPAEGSPRIVKMEQSNVLPNPEIKATVGGIGSSRILKYDVKPIEGQVVRLIEEANGAHRPLRTIRRGGKGTIRFQTAEADSPRRKIVAEVVQDEMPRDNIDVARFTAPNPTLGPAKRVRVRRRGKTAVITWRKAPLAARYDVVVEQGDGSRVYVPVTGRRLRVVARDVAKSEGVRVRVTSISPRGRRGRTAQARLKGTMKLGAAKPAKARKPVRKGKRGRAQRRG